MAYATFYERLGGRPTFEKVHKLFYDKVYEHPWLKLFFAKVEQKHIESQQTDFVAQSFGGPRRYMGKPVNTAHKHIFITYPLSRAQARIIAALQQRVSLEVFVVSIRMIEVVMQAAALLTELSCLGDEFGGGCNVAQFDQIRRELEVPIVFVDLVV